MKNCRGSYDFLMVLQNQRPFLNEDWTQTCVVLVLWVLLLFGHILSFWGIFEANAIFSWSKNDILLKMGKITVTMPKTLHEVRDVIWWDPEPDLILLHTVQNILASVFLFFLVFSPCISKWVIARVLFFFQILPSPEESCCEWSLCLYRHLMDALNCFSIFMFFIFSSTGWANS